MILVHFWWAISSVTNAFYGVMSGWFGDVTIFVSAGTGIIMYYRHSRCHVNGCNRHGKYPFKHYKLCEIHHPEVSAEGVTHEHIRILSKEK